MNNREQNILMNLDRLKHLISNVKAEGKEIQAKIYQDYYEEIRTRPRMDEIIKGTQHEIKKYE